MVGGGTNCAAMNEEEGILKD
ncbi:uncharacterized protein G2W53_038582 [Senna tora]|uniref:Uncharacterized protein n=1 Tax=Senna tora TaxID=362788 RepID=A0A834W5C0_9FABA|nr:uncharacterized protein G2W53_038582 [Senna tora]